MKRGLWALLFLATGSCNFDAAFSRYCQNNPNCRTDGATQDGARDTGDASRPSASRLRMCKDKSDCGPNEACALPAGVCVAADCQSVVECPGGSNCELADPNSPTGPRFCTCTFRTCKGGTRCHLGDRICEPECDGNQDCSARNFDPPRKICDEMSGTCVQCKGNSDCPSSRAARCDQRTGMCVACQSSFDCSGRSDGLTDCAVGVCVRPPISGGP